MADLDLIDELRALASNHRVPAESVSDLARRAADEIKHLRARSMWRHPTHPDAERELVTVLCKVLPAADGGAHVRSSDLSVSSGDFATGDHFVSVGFVDGNNYTAAGWFVAGWDMNQDCWTDAPLARSHVWPVESCCDP